ncbi:MAG: DMT family transporter [Myxococcales bacterium]|nr:DMT family transporter [Myxococcales bacterium]
MSLPVRGVWRAYLWMGLAALSLSWMGVFVKMLTRAGMPAVEVIFFRASLMTIFFGWWAWWRGIDLVGTRRFLLFLRGFIGAIALFCFFYALSNIRLADAMALNLASPIFVVFFAHLWLGERMRGLDGVFLVGALFGALMIIRPGTSVFQWSSVVGLISAVLSGVAYVLVRALSKTESKSSIIFAFSWVSCAMSLPFLGSVYQSPVGWQWLWLLLVGVLSILGQLFLTMAYASEQAGPVSSFNYLGIVFSGIWAYSLWGEIPDTWAVAGACLLVGCCVLLSVVRSFRAVQEQPK